MDGRVPGRQPTTSQPSGALLRNSPEDDSGIAPEAAPLRLRNSPDGSAMAPKAVSLRLRNSPEDDSGVPLDAASLREVVALRRKAKTLEGEISERKRRE